MGQHEKADTDSNATSGSFANPGSCKAEEKDAKLWIQTKWIPKEFFENEIFQIEMYSALRLFGLCQQANFRAGKRYCPAQCKWRHFKLQYLFWNKSVPLLGDCHDNLQMYFIYTPTQETSVLIEMTVPELRMVKSCRREVKMLKQLWDYIFLVRTCIDDWRMTMWTDIDVENMDMECKKFAKVKHVFTVTHRVFSSTGINVFAPLGMAKTILFCRGKYPMRNVK